MKKTIYYILAVLTLLTAMSITTSCTKEVQPEVDPKPEPGPEEIITPVIDFSMEEGSLVVIYDNQVHVTVIPFTVTPAGKGTVVKRIDDTNQQDAIVKYNDATGEGTLSLSYWGEFQNGEAIIEASINNNKSVFTFMTERAYIRANKAEVVVENKETNATFSITANVPYTINIESDWVESYENDEGTFTVTFPVNQEETERTAMFTFNDENNWIGTKVSLCQKGVYNELAHLSDEELLRRILQKQYDAGWTELYDWTILNPDVEFKTNNMYRVATVNGQKRIVEYTFGLTDIVMEMQIPEEIGYMTELHKLRITTTDKGIVDENGWSTGVSYLVAHLYGEIPESFKNLTNLIQLSIDKCHISGEIPEFFKNYTKLEHLWITQTKMTGTLPDWLAEMDNLINFQFNNNRFNGKISQKLTETNWWNINYNIYKNENKLAEQGYSFLYIGQLDNNRLWIEGYEDEDKYPYGFDTEAVNFDVEFFKQQKDVLYNIDWNYGPWAGY